MPRRQHQVQLDGTRILAASKEIIEDRIAQVMEHHADPMASDKASTIDLKIKAVPKGDGSGFNFEVSSSVRLSPVKSFEVEMFQQYGTGGLIEFNPRQMRIPQTVEYVDPVTGEVTTNGQ